MLIIKILAALSILSLVALFVGESEALRNEHPRFTKWWRKHIVGEDIYHGK